MKLPMTPPHFTQEDIEFAVYDYKNISQEKREQIERGEVFFNFDAQRVEFPENP